MKCGHCKTPDVDVAHVRACADKGLAADVAKMAKATEPATEGMYRRDGQIYKVVRAVHGSGRLYAQVAILDQMANGQTEVRFQVARGMVARLTQAHRMTVDEAAAFGHLYGVCIRCAATLTDDASIKRGLGPVCATKI